MPLLAAALVCAALGWTLGASVFALLAAFVAYFFRNPHREIPADPALIVSPADGKVVKLDRVGNVTRFSIFLSLFDVHVNRSPMEGTIDAIDYTSGRFLAAYHDAASIENERNTILVRNGDVTVVFAQIAGVIARRIVCWKRVGDPVARGELVGLIRFGSRVDVTLPASVEPLVAVGDRVRGGSSAIGRLRPKD